MTDKAKRLGAEAANPEIHFRPNNGASEECPFEATTYPGLTKREYFAGLAIQGLLSNGDRRSFETVAEVAVFCADMLLEGLSK
jgi:hypothetical protein